MRIAVLALQGLFDTGLTVMLDAFSLANRFAAAKMGGRPHFELSVVGVRKKVRSGQGLTIPVQAITEDSMRGRVMSVYNVAFRGGMPIGMLVVGKLIPIYSAPLTMSVVGTTTILLGLYFLFVQRRITQL